MRTFENGWRGRTNRRFPMYACYEELEQVFDHFHKYNMKIILGDFKAKVGRENIFKPTIGNESLHQDSNDNGVRIVNFVME